MSSGPVFKPLLDRILVSRQVAPKVTKGGILLPSDSAAKKTLIQATVVATGNGRTNPQTGKITPIESVKVGDTVVIPDFSGYRFADEPASGSNQKTADQEVEFRIVREDEILGVLTK
eukprot:Gregarina_sp_Poly_1__2964@NODE_182_length_11803_cov_169_166752_g162_i0_p11_GENE_NODE_182_length_11803_cov_169_166752_g162_i0NODE_182_length_11803_cov_169_166752_g162_i0_p11_ORF_typecomplete_len117_score18_79Cpn10/PF00166_21/3_6e19Cupin_6/PF12852_7/0_15_NODE_182_length_11803_cov_169_166752_g162_i049399